MHATKWDLSKSTSKLDEISNFLNQAGRGSVLILCHNNPDPDAIASAFAMAFLFSKKFSVRASLAYGGVVTRAENKAMIHRLRIKMQQLSSVDQLSGQNVALIDAQPNTGNNLLGTRGPEPFLVMDHHPLRKSTMKAVVQDIRPTYGATSTIAVEYLLAAGLTPTRSVANALLYGLKTDTGSLVRGVSKQDFLAFNYLSPLTNPRVLGLIEKPKLSLEYFCDYSEGLSKTVIYRDVAVTKFGFLRSESIVPELADTLLRIDGVSWSLCIGEINDMMIMSLRSTSRKYAAGTILRRLVGKSGSAGGHKDMAGGSVSLHDLDVQQRNLLPGKFIRKFLELIGREGVVPKSLIGYRAGKEG
jgi:nanoRNase/pAp phosphatase (c-di-AMP/oligoRNAs hydrolase)